MVQRKSNDPRLDVRYNMFNGGFGGGGGMTSSQLKNVALPEMIKCNRCNKAKNHHCYSNKQLTEARMKVSKNGANTPIKINCTMCTAGPVLDMKCTHCMVTKSLADFKKTHRKNKDEAVCSVCMDKRMGIDYNESEVKADSDHDSDSSASNPWEGDGDDTESILNGSTFMDTQSGSYLSSTGGNRNSSMNTTDRASSGGVRLPTGDNNGAEWQNATNSRVRRPAASSATFGSSSTAQTPKFDNSTTRRPAASSAMFSPTSTAQGPKEEHFNFNPNAYGNPKSPASVAGSEIAKATSRFAPLQTSKAFTRIKAYQVKQDNECEEPEEEFPDTVPAPEEDDGLYAASNENDAIYFSEDE